MTRGSGADFARLFEREFDRLSGEIRAYERDSDLWTLQGAQANPPGTLVLHLVGNLMHYVGEGLGGVGYARDRAREFSMRGVPRAGLVELVDECRETVCRVLEALDEEVMERPYPGEPPERMRGIHTRAFLLHLTWHLGWHLGQIYYHRLGTGSSRPVS